MSKLSKPLVNYALAALTGVLLVLIFPGWDLVGLAPFALTPLLFALAREHRPKHRFLLGYLAGNVYWFGLCPWIQFVLDVHGGMGFWGGWGTFVLFSLFKSLHLGVFALLAGIVLSQWYAIPAVAALWTGIERTHGELGFAWLCLGNAGIDMALPMRLAPWLGVYGLSFLFAMMAAAAAGVLMKKPRKQVLWLLAIPALLALPNLPPPDPGSETAVMLQPNIPEERDWTPESARQMHRMLIQRSLEAALPSKARLILWPEVPGPVYYYRDPALRQQIGALARQSNAYVLAGTVSETRAREPLNSAVLVNPQVPVPADKTRQVFQRLASTALSTASTARATPEAAGPRAWLDLIAAAGNDLEAPAVSVVPDVAEVLKALRADSLTQLARLSGAGPTCFAVTETAADAAALAAVIAAKHPAWWVRATQLH